MGERAHIAAWKAAIAAAGPPSFDFGAWEVRPDLPPADLPPAYVLVTVARRPGATRRTGGRELLYGWRLSTRSVGRAIDSARWARERTRAAISERQAPISGGGVLLMETEDEIGPDEGMFSGLTTWVYAARE